MPRIALTSRYKQKMLVLPIKAQVLKPDFIDKAKKISRDGKVNLNSIEKLTAIWDTGATDTSINQKWVDKLGLVQINFKDVNTGNGPATQRPVYLVDLLLIVNDNPILRIPSLKIVSLVLGDNLDLIIGMDVIGQGDLAITKDVNGYTVLSFTYPSHKEIDFVPEADKENISNMNRHQRRALGIKS